MHSKKKIVVTILLVLGFLSMPSFSQAMEIGTQDSDISVDTIPESPEPYEDVTINLTSYATDLNKAMIQWQIGKNTVLAGVGKTSYSFKASGPSTSTVFSVGITPAGSTSSITKQIVISPSEIELLWESVDGYTPPFYKGRSFASAESLIKVVAVPNTNAVKSNKNIVYTWKNGDKTVQGASGYGKDSYIFANNELNKSEEITVSASSVDGSYNATKTITIPIVSPKIVFYKKSPTEGTQYNNALSDETFISEDEATVVATPYFLALRGNEDEFTYNWQINGEDIGTPSRKTELTIRPSDRGGYANIGVVIENLNTFFQKVSGQLKLTL